MIEQRPNPSDPKWSAIDDLRALVNTCLADVDQLHGRVAALEAEVAELKAGCPTGPTLADVVALHPSVAGLPDGAA